MPTLSLIAAYISAMIFVGFIWRCRRHLRIPGTLLGSGIVLIVGQFWSFAEAVLGAEQIQALLLGSFPVANDPDSLTVSGLFSFDGTEVGMVYWNLMIGFGLVSSVGLLLLGLGLHLFARRLMLEHQARQHPLPPP